MAIAFSSPNHSKTDLQIMIRRGGAQDIPFLRSMLPHAYNFHVNVLETDVPVARYVDGWGREGVSYPELPHVVAASPVAALALPQSN